MKLGAEHISSAAHSGIQRVISMEILFKAGRTVECFCITHYVKVSAPGVLA
jgi:hypothetical protein